MATEKSSEVRSNVNYIIFINQTIKDFYRPTNNLYYAARIEKTFSVPKSRVDVIKKFLTCDFINPVNNYPLLTHYLSEITNPVEKIRRYTFLINAYKNYFNGKNNTNYSNKMNDHIIYALEQERDTSFINSITDEIVKNTLKELIQEIKNKKTIKSNNNAIVSHFTWRKRAATKDNKQDQNQKLSKTDEACPTIPTIENTRKASTLRYILNSNQPSPAALHKTDEGIKNAEIPNDTKTDEGINNAEIPNDHSDLVADIRERIKTALYSNPTPNFFFTQGVRPADNATIIPNVTLTLDKSYGEKLFALNIDQYNALRQYGMLSIKLNKDNTEIKIDQAMALKAIQGLQPVNQNRI